MQVRDHSGWNFSAFSFWSHCFALPTQKVSVFVTVTGPFSRKRGKISFQNICARCHTPEIQMELNVWPRSRFSTTIITPANAKVTYTEAAEKLPTISRQRRNVRKRVAIMHWPRMPKLKTTHCTIRPNCKLWREQKWNKSKGKKLKFHVGMNIFIELLNSRCSMDGLAEVLIGYFFW